MQFEVATHRMARAQRTDLAGVPALVARVVDPVDAEFMGRRARYRSGRLA